MKEENIEASPIQWKSYRTHVAGMAKVKGAQDYAKGCRSGDGLYLARDPDNKHDSSAIAIHLLRNGELLGRVPIKHAAKIAPELDDGLMWRAKVANLRAETGRIVRLDVLIEVRMPR